jgi:hypothetical protein
MRDYINKTETGIFIAAQEQFDRMKDQLASKEAAEMEHGDVEELLDREGKELLRRMLQAYFDLRSMKEERVDSVAGSDGIVRDKARHDKSRNPETIFGRVEFERWGYGIPGYSSLFPLDGELNLSPDQYSHGLRKRIAEEVSKSSFEEAVEAVDKTTGGHVPKRQAEELARKAAQDFDSFYDARKAPVLQDMDDFVVMTSDGKGVVMRKKDLREQTRKAAEKAKEKRKRKRLAKGEKRRRKRMATVAAVYSIGANVRTPEEVMGIMTTEGEKPKRFRANDKRVWASLEKDPDEVVEDVFLEAKSRDPKQLRDWVYLADGDHRQLKNIIGAAELHDVGLTIILDIIHVIEYLWKASYCFFKEGSEEAEQWVTERALRILQGNSSQVAAGMRRSATRRRLSEKKREGVDTCARYLLNHRDYLHYDEYLAAGMPIATGVIEGACRHLVKDRMDLTGARWSLAGAEAVLKLRALRSSGDFDEYWEFHKRQEYRRNHESCYAEAV